MKEVDMSFRASPPVPPSGVEARALSEAQFLAGEDAGGAIVVLEPETDLSKDHMAALAARGAKGFVSDFVEDPFAAPDAIPELDAGAAGRGLLAIAVSPRAGMRLRTLAGRGGLRLRLGGGAEGRVEAIVPPTPAKRDRSGDPDVGKGEILAALSEVGVKKGDTLLVHSSISACGHIVGGAKTILDALVEALGPDGNFFLPTFQRSECYLNGISKRWDHRPSDHADRASDAVRWVGMLPLEFMRLYPDAPRGVHISHSWAGWGRDAAEVLSRQAADEPPFSDNSCPMRVLDMGGKILHFGSKFGRTSFVHCFETHYNLPGLGPSYYDVRLPDGTITWKFVPNGVPGPREFYTKNEEARFFREAIGRGLEISRAKLGVGTLALVGCRELWRIGSELVREDPRIIIGDI